MLDACAAPGGKATHLAELMHDDGIIYAVDRKAVRLEVLKENCRRLRIRSVEAVTGDIRHPSEWHPVRKHAVERTNRPLQFDRMLVDAPCSGLGVLRRHPEAKWRKSAESIGRHHLLQVQILEAVAPRLRAGGVLVYSTCSNEPEENESVIDQFLSAHQEFRRESANSWLPEQAREFLTERGDLSTIGNRHFMDSFYAARLTKVTA